MSKDKTMIQVKTFNWGPCLIHLKIQDDFKKALIEEAKKNEVDFSSKLAGHRRKDSNSLHGCSDH